MGTLRVRVDAARSSHPLVPAKLPMRPQLVGDPVLLLWRRLIDMAVHEAKKTRCGLPTDGAIQQMWWLEEHRPKRTDREDWERSFACACEWLEEDAETYRAQLVGEVEEARRQDYEKHVRSWVYIRRAMVMAAAGFPTAIERQMMMPLVAQEDYDDVVGVERPDPPARGIGKRRKGMSAGAARVLPQLFAARVTRHRAGGPTTAPKTPFPFPRSPL